MNRKVLIFSLMYHPFIGGAEIAIKEITDRIPQKSIHFDMITLRLNSELPRTEKIGNIIIHRIGFSKKGARIEDGKKFLFFLNKYLFPMMSFFKAVSLHRKNKYDAIWCMLANYAIIGALFFKLFNPKVLYVLTIQDGSSAEQIKERAGFLFPLLKQGVLKADLVQVISTFLVGVVRDIGYKGDVVMVSNGVDNKHFSQRYEEKELDKLRNKLNLKKDKIYLITTTRLILTRGIEDVIKSLNYLPNNILFLILGTGPDKLKLEDLAKKNKVSNRTYFIGHVDHKELPKYLRLANFFIRPSLIEGFGNSFIEAMAAEIPTVATQVGGITDFLFDPEKNPNKPPTGLFCNVKDPKNIAVQVKRLISNDELTSLLIKNASKLVKEKYDWGLIAENIETKVFKKVFK